MSITNETTDVRKQQIACSKVDPQVPRIATSCMPTRSFPLRAQITTSRGIPKPKTIKSLLPDTPKTPSSVAKNIEGSWIVARNNSSSSKNIKKFGGIIALFFSISLECIACRKEMFLPSLLSCEALVQEDEHLAHVELYVFEIKVLLVVLLHFEQVVQLEVQFEKTPVAAFVVQ